MKSLEALERLEKETPVYFSTLYDIDMWEEDIEIVRKALKALEIIRNNEVDCYDIINSTDYKHYLFLTKTYDKSWILKQKDYKLLKEVLIND